MKNDNPRCMILEKIMLKVRFPIAFGTFLQNVSFENSFFYCLLQFNY